MNSSKNRRFFVDPNDMGTTRPGRHRFKNVSPSPRFASSQAHSNPRATVDAGVVTPRRPTPTPTAKPGSKTKMPPWHHPGFSRLSQAGKDRAMKMYEESLKIDTEPVETTTHFEPEHNVPIPASQTKRVTFDGPSVEEFEKAVQKLETSIKEIAGSTKSFYGKIWKAEGLKVYANPPGEGERHEVVHTYQSGSNWPKLCYPIIRIKSTGDSWMKTEWVTSDGSLNSGWIRVTNGSTREVPFSDYSIYPQDDVTESRITSLENKITSLASTIAELHEQLAELSASAPLMNSKPIVHASAGAPSKPVDEKVPSYFGLPSMTDLKIK